MKGRFRYRSALTGIISVTLVLAVLMLTPNFSGHYSVLNFVLYIAGAVIVGFSGYVPCSFSADENGVKIRTGFKRTYIRYDDIMYVNIKSRMSGQDKTGGFFYENVLTIQTYSCEYTFREDCGTLELAEFLHDPEKVHSKLICTELNELTEYIKERI